MNLTSPEPLVNFTNIQWNEISLKPKFLLWYDLWKIYNSKDYIIAPKEELVLKYQNFDDWENFLLIQLKFFLIRNSSVEENKLPEKLLYWSRQLPGFCKVNSDFLLLAVQLPQFKFQRSIGMFAYTAEHFIKYIKAWNESTVVLDSWKRYRFIEVPKEIVEVAGHFDSSINFMFPSGVMRKLFDQEVLLIYERIFKPRLKDKQLGISEKSLIERVLGLAGTPLDLEYLNRNFFRTSEKKRIPDKLLKCRNGKLSLEELDIHSLSNMRMYFALIKYYETLLDKPKKEKNVQPVIWFMNLSKDNRDEVFECLKNVFDSVQNYCDEDTKWIDFKSIFNKNGTSTKIIWLGHAEVLNYIFRKLHKVLFFSGGKWNAVAHYFRRRDIKDTSLSADKLAGSSHYNANKDKKLVQHLNSLISILS